MQRPESDDRRGSAGVVPHRSVSGLSAGTAEGRFRFMHQRQAETEAMVQPDGVADDLGREPLAMIAGGSVLHSATVPADPST